MSNRIAFCLVSWLLCLAGFCQGFFQSVCAEYKVDPLRVELAVPEGKNVGTALLTVSNTGSNLLRLKAYLGNWSMDAAGGLSFDEVLQPDASVPHSSSQWVRFNPREFEVQPGQSQVVRMAVVVPANTTVGEYRSILFFEELTPKSVREETIFSDGKTRANLQIKQRFGVVVYVYNGKVSPQVTLLPAPENLKAIRIENGKAIADLTLGNTGTRHFRGVGSLLLSQKDPATDTFQPVREVPLKDANELVVLPGQTLHVRQVLAVHRESLQDASIVNNPGLSDLPPGEYRAELTVADKTAPDVSNTAVLQQVFGFQWP